MYYVLLYLLLKLQCATTSGYIPVCMGVAGILGKEVYQPQLECLYAGGLDHAPNNTLAPLYISMNHISAQHWYTYTLRNRSLFF